ncbi:MAG: DUF2784 domain-containing protein [Gemmatimonadota bacterium]|nr:DUF2784 domain-containing protein [Gemmatimonadota bacterium]MDH5759218.1 DUF2784 domain-containing protein [Gemmatimonadota bacterium]
MVYRILADVVLAAHVAFLLFVIGGGFLVLRWPRVVWIHAPCALWGAWVEFAQRVCPLTPLEIGLRRRAGREGYTGGFLEHYVEPIVYPPGLTHTHQVVLGIGLILLTSTLYGVAWRRSRRRDDPGPPRPPDR